MQPAPSLNVDLLILGGGPAGLALAIMAARSRLVVTLLERSRYQHPRTGETFGGELAALLQEVGLWDAVRNVPRLPFRGQRSSWGEFAQIERNAMFNPYGEGWHVDRAAFDQALASAAVQSGVNVLTGCAATSVEPADAAWSVQLTDGQRLGARHVVDAGGRDSNAWPAASRPGQWVRMDRMVAWVARLGARATKPEPVLQIEAVQNGWWYAAPQPDGGLLVSLMTDVDLLAAGPRETLPVAFMAALAESTHTAALCAGARLAGEPWVARADSGFRHPDHGEAWCTIGDAAMACDPLAGDGVVRAIRSARRAAQRVSQALQRPIAVTPEVDSGSAYPPLREAFIKFLHQRARHYAREGRFPDSLFWQRRQPLDLRAARIFLDPQSRLVCANPSPGPQSLAHVEALLPYCALRPLLARLREPVVAHEALAALRAKAPLEDRRLIVAVQELIGLDVIRVLEN
ncbi:MAG: FAD-dependent oxidoreductase [Rhodocyclaceae bacterium]|nr:FAD-dependent oxidoreductase [Rhodocyclaceae bacterium]